MSNLTQQSPLMQPVVYNGQEYFTSHYFHQQYLTNSLHGGKYERHHHFLRTIRSIEAYGIYIEHGNIVELAWEQVKSSSNQLLVEALLPIFRERGYQKLYLLDATAQIALSHHLDDEVSKQVSVAANTMVAKQAAKKLSSLLPDEIATRKLSARLDAGKLLGTPLHVVQAEAVKAVLAETGVDYRPLLISAPAQDYIQESEKMLEPTSLAKEFGWGENKGAAMNRALATIGWQVKKIGGGWESTPAGRPYSAPHAWTSHYSPKTEYNLKWKVEAVRKALTEAGLLKQDQAVASESQ